MAPVLPVCISVAFYKYQETWSFQDSRKYGLSRMLFYTPVYSPCSIASSTAKVVSNF